MTAPRSQNSDGHAVGDGTGQRRTTPEKQLIGAFDLLAAQIDALRQDIDYLKEQVAQLQESDRAPERGKPRQNNKESLI